MRVGVVILPEHRWCAAEPKWLAAEELGFDHAWTFDHIGWRSLVDGPWFSAVPTLTAAALRTRRIRLGMMVTSPNFRQPVPFARDLLALDDISDGRFTLGIGAGGPGYDTVVMGAPQLTGPQRFARFAEFTSLLDSLLAKPRTDFAGEYFTAVEARNAPGCVQRPRLPFVLAADGPKALRLAAREGEGWVTTGGGRAAESMDQWWKAVRTTSARFDDALAEAGRESAGVQRFLQADTGPVAALQSVDFFTDLAGRAAEAGFTDLLIPWPRDSGVYAARESVLEEVAGLLPKL